MTTTTDTSPSTATNRFVHQSGAACAVGGLLLTGLGLARIGQTSDPAPSGFDLWMALAAAGLALVIVGLIGLARSGLAGPGALARIGLGAAFLGYGLFLAAHVIAAIDPAKSDGPLFQAGALGALGLILTGIAVLRARRWNGWLRVTPLLTGLYPFVILIPAFAIFGEPNFPAIAGFGACLALLGVALTTTRIG